MKNLLLIFAIALASTTSFAQPNATFSTINVLNQAQIPRFTTLPAQSRHGAIVYLYDNADSGFYVRRQNNTWKKIGNDVIDFRRDSTHYTITLEDGKFFTAPFPVVDFGGDTCYAVNNIGPITLTDSAGGFACYYIPASDYSIDCKRYSASPDTLCLQPPDPGGDGRFDIIEADTLGQYHIRQGIVAAEPVLPEAGPYRVTIGAILVQLGVPLPETIEFPNYVLYGKNNTGKVYGDPLFVYYDSIKQLSIGYNLYSPQSPWPYPFIDNYQSNMSLKAFNRIGTRTSFVAGESFQFETSGWQRRQIYNINNQRSMNIIGNNPPGGTLMSNNDNLNFVAIYDSGGTRPFVFENPLLNQFVFSVNSPRRAMLIPRLTTAKLNEIGTRFRDAFGNYVGALQEGMIAFNTDTKQLCYSRTGGWECISALPPEDLYVTKVGASIGDIDTLWFAKNLDTTNFYFLKGGDEIISGGQVLPTGVPYQYQVTPLFVRIGGVFYNFPATTLSVDPLSDPDSSRVDLFYVSSLGAFVRKGVESANPLFPQTETGELRLTYIQLNPTAPAGLEEVIVIYNENVAPPTEWTGSTTATADFDYATDPFLDTKSALVTTYSNNTYVSWSYAGAIDRRQFSSISAFIKLGAAWPNNNRIGVQFYNGATAVTDVQQLPLSNSTLTYQGVAIGLGNFAWTQDFFTSVRFIKSGNPVQAAQFDYVILQRGIDVGTPGVYVQDIRRVGDVVEKQVSNAWSSAFDISDKADKATVLTINGVAQDISQDRSWTVAPITGDSTHVPFFRDNNQLFTESAFTYFTTNPNNAFSERTLRVGTGIYPTLANYSAEIQAVGQTGGMFRLGTANSSIKAYMRAYGTGTTIGNETNHPLSFFTNNNVGSPALTLNASNASAVFNAPEVRTFSAGESFFRAQSNAGYIQLQSTTTGNYMQLLTSNDASVFRITGPTTEKMRITGQHNMLLGTINDISSSIFTATSTSKGILPPRMTAAQRIAIGSPVAGLLTYDSDSARYMLHNGSSWKGIAYTGEGGGGGGVTTMAAIGSSPNANGATISGSTLTLQPANESFGGVVTTSNQRFSGFKSFTPSITTNGGVYDNLLIGGDHTLTLGASVNGLRVSSKASVVSGTHWLLNLGTNTAGDGAWGTHTTKLIVDANGLIDMRPGGDNANKIIFTTSGGDVGIGANGASMQFYKRPFPATTGFQFTANASGFSTSPTVLVNISESQNNGLLSNVRANFNYPSTGTTDFPVTITNSTAGSPKISMFTDGGSLESGIGVGTDGGIQQFIRNLSVQRWFTWHVGGFKTGTSSSVVPEGEIMRLNANGLSINGLQSAGAALTINSTTKGFLPPRMTAVQRVAIGSPVAGLLTYDTDSARYMLHNGSAWKGIAYTGEGGGGGSNIYNSNGSLTANRTVTGGAFSLTMNANLIGSFLSVNNFTSGGTAISAQGISAAAIIGSSTGFNSTGVYGVGDSKGVWGSGQTGVQADGTLYGIYATGSFAVNAVGTSGGNAIIATSTDGLTANFTRQQTAGNTVVTGVAFQRTTSSSAANGIGQKLEFLTQSTVSSNALSNEIISKWTDATHATRTSQFSVTGVHNGTTKIVLEIEGSGIWRLPQGLTDYADDAAAAAGGIPVNGLYRTGSFIKIRVN